MFTGLIEAVGTVSHVSGTNPRRLRIASPLAAEATSVAVGDSVAIDGCCLTVVEHDAQSWVFEAATETLARTTLGTLQQGARVNLERALRVNDRLGGHIVAGHVDGVGTVRVREQRGSALYLGVEAPAEVARLAAPRGSVTLAGVSLTITDVQKDIIFVGLIPHTLAMTTLGERRIGEPVNLEADLIARYVERLMHYQPAAQGAP